MEITARGVNPMYSEALYYLAVAGVEEQSRNGPVISLTEPILLTYTAPEECVLFSPLRDANPFFHVMEFLWLVAGRADIDWPVYFNKNFMQFSDDGVEQWASYGRRWRSWFGHDQLKFVIRELSERPNSRRAVLNMWDSAKDPAKVLAKGVDVPCNLCAMFDLRDGVLNVTVANRSNDAILGALGANVVQFALLQSYIAAALGVRVGSYRQFSNNFHAYPSTLIAKGVSGREGLKLLALDASSHDYYLQGKVAPLPLIQNITQWDRELFRFMKHPLTRAIEYEEPFFRGVAAPMYWAWNERKEKGLNGTGYVTLIVADDWRLACTEWIERRAAKKAQGAN